MAIDTTRAGAAPGVVLRGISWNTYNKIRDHPSNNGLRMSYLDGTLILMSPEFVHDRCGWRIAIVLAGVCEALGIPSQGTATTTLRRKGDGRRKGSGKEPDFGFYFRENEPRMRTKSTIDLDVDPPPDLAIEIDYKADSTKALALYARLGVPEVWRYKPKSRTLWFGRLAGETYESVDRSVNLPRLTPALMLLALARLDEVGETAGLPWIREWARGLPEPGAGDEP